MKAKKKVVIITACVCSLLLVIGVAFHFSKDYLIDLGIIHLSEKQVISYFEKNKGDLKIAADYVLNQSMFYNENTETQKSDKEFKPGEIIESLGIYHNSSRRLTMHIHRFVYEMFNNTNFDNLLPCIS